MSDPATPPQPPRLSAKERFLAQEEDANAWRNFSRSDLLYNVLTYSVTEYSLAANPSSEQIKAVRAFIETMLTIAEPKSAQRSPFPDKRLVAPKLSDPDKKEEKK